MNIQFEIMKEQIEGLNHLYQASHKLSQKGSIEKVTNYFEPIKSEYKKVIVTHLNSFKDSLSDEELLELGRLSLPTTLKFDIGQMVK